MACFTVLIEQRTGKTMPHVLLNLYHKDNLEKNILLPASFSDAKGKKKKKEVKVSYFRSSCDGSYSIVTLYFCLECENTVIGEGIF